MLLLVNLLFSLLFGQPEQKFATVVIFQAGTYGRHQFDLIVEDQPLMEPMKRNTSVEFKVPAGDVDIRTEKTRYLQDSGHYVIEVEEGNTYYLQAEIAYEFPKTIMRLSVVNSNAYKKVEKKLTKISKDLLNE